MHTVPKEHLAMQRIEEELKYGLMKSVTPSGLSRAWNLSLYQLLKFLLEFYQHIYICKPFRPSE